MQSVLNNSTGVSALSIFLEPLRDHVSLDNQPRSPPSPLSTDPQGGQPRGTLGQYLLPHHPRVQTGQTLKWGLGKGHGRQPVV